MLLEKQTGASGSGLHAWGVNRHVLSKQIAGAVLQQEPTFGAPSRPDTVDPDPVALVIVIADQAGCVADDNYLERSLKVVDAGHGSR